MALPAGVDTVRVTFGSGLGFDGGTVEIVATATPSADLVWAATGQPLLAYALKSTASTDGGFFDLPSVDQAGFVQAGTAAAFSFWSYTISVAYSAPGYSSQRTYKGVQPLSNQTTIDLDLLPYDGSAQPPTIGTIPAVTSVNGQTGAVSVTVNGADVTIQAADITDSTAVGRALIKAADAAAARSAIQAGTSNLTLGTTGSTAKAGNYAPDVAGVTGLTEAIAEIPAAALSDPASSTLGRTSGRRFSAAFNALLATALAPLGFVITRYWDPDTDVWEALNVPSWYNRPVRWDSTIDVTATPPPERRTRDRWLRRKAA